MNEVRAIIFDLDGTLADTFPLIVDAWNASVSLYTHRTYSADEVIARFGVPDMAMIRREIPGRSAEHAIEVYHEYYEQHHDSVRLFDGVREMLDALRARRIPMGQLTGKGRLTCDITLRELQLTDYFTSVITGDEMEHQKPHADGPLRVARALRVEPMHCAIVGDSPADIGAGKNAKMVSVAAMWAGVYRERIKTLSVDVCLEKPAEILSIVTPH